MADYTTLTCPALANPMPLSENSVFYNQVQQMKTLATQLLTDEDGWVNHSDKNGVTIDLKTVPDQTLPFVRGKTTLSAGVEAVHRILENYHNKSTWDVRHHKTSLVDVETNTVFTQHAQFTTPWPLSWRDFIALCVVDTWSGDGTLHKMFQSTPVEPKSRAIPSPFESYVRGEIIMATYTLVPNSADPTKTDVTYIVATDPKGSIPTSIIKSTSPELVSGLATVEKMLKTQPEVIQQIVQQQEEWYALIDKLAKEKQQAQ